MTSRAALLLVTAATLGACREREVGLDAGAAVVPKSSEARLLYPSAPGSFVDLVEAARSSVVALRATSPVKSGPAAMFPGAPEAIADVALGTGFLVEAGGVYVLTNDHVVAAAPELQAVLADGSAVPARVVGRDLRLDLALLALDVPRAKALPLGDSDALRVGEWIVVLGNPFGDEVTASAGIVSATGREAAGSLVPGRGTGHRTFLQTDARIHRGNTGGPVLDTAGHVVGVALATGDRPEELSFAIPINRVKDVLTQLRDHGGVSRSWLGVLAKPVTADVAATLGLPQPAGALVTEIKAGSPAARSTLRSGDVILKWAGAAVDHRSLPWVVAQTPVGKPVAVTVWRNRAEVAVTILTEKMPE